MAGSFCAKVSHQDMRLRNILFDEPASLSKLACEMEKVSHQDMRLRNILFDEPASSSRGYPLTRYCSPRAFAEFARRYGVGELLDHP